MPDNPEKLFLVIAYFPKSGERWEQWREAEDKVSALQAFLRRSSHVEKFLDGEAIKFRVLDEAEAQKYYNPSLHSNCAILEFARPLVRSEIEGIKAVIEDEGHRGALPRLVMADCGERDGNSVVPVIAADED